MPGLLFNLRAKLLIGLGMLLLLLVAQTVLIHHYQQINEDAGTGVEHAQSVLRAASDVLVTVNDLELRYFQFLATGSPDAYAAYWVDVGRYAELFARVADLTADDPNEAARWLAIGADLDRQRTEVLDPAIAVRGRVLAGEAGPDERGALRAVANMADPLAEVRARFTIAQADVRAQLAQQTQLVNESNLFVDRVLLIGTVTTTLFGLAIAWLLSTNVAHAVERLASASQAIAAGDLGQRIGFRNRRDEIGRAGAAFDQMAAILERDVAALAQSEARYKHLVDHAGDIIYQADSNGRFTWVNPTASVILGYSEAELIGMPYVDLIHPDDRASIRRSYVQQFMRRLPMRYSEFRAIAKDGSVVWIGQNVQLVEAEDGRVGFQAIARDITERRTVERMKDEFISVVSHELRTPLTSIRGSLGLLAAGLMGPISERAARMVEVAVSNSDRLIRLINDILDIERIESGRVTMAMEWTNARDLVQRSVDSIRGVADAARVEVIAHAEPLALRADPDRVEQTLTNLLGNAIKFSPSGAKVEVHATRDGANALFSVRDYGRGIPAEKIETIFGRFVQVDASDAREKGGSGLGLAIARSIVEQHSGRIWATSTVGEGSTLSFNIPLPAHVRAEVEPPDGVPAAPAILVYAAEPAALARVGGMLDRHGYRSVGARTGEETVRLASHEQPAAILLDAAPPGVKTWETLLSLRDNPRTRDIPVLIQPVTTELLRDMLERILARRAIPVRILIVEDDARLAGLLAATFRHYGVEPHHATIGSGASAISLDVDPDLLLLNLGTPPGNRFEVVDWLREHDRLRRVTVVVYTARDLDVEERGKRVLTLLHRLVPAA